MIIQLGFGDSAQCVEIPDGRVRDILLPEDIPHTLTDSQAVALALRSPIGTPRLRELVRPGERVAVVTSDITRPMPTAFVMPYILDELFAAGAAAKDITLVFARGSHRRHSEEEMRHLAGDSCFEQIRCVDSDPDDCVRMGVTSRGTPVDITRAAAEADRRICLGNIEYHYFAGYSGGAKAIMPGVSTPEAIQANHKRMLEPMACAGELERNPVRQDLEEAAAVVGVDFILNVVLGPQKQILRAYAGDVTAAHRAGCTFLDTLYRKRISARADIVIASQGGAPKDLNLYQTQKALDNAGHAVRDGGIIILVGSCREGLGHTVFEEWMLSARRPSDLTARIRRQFQLGGHKAAAIAATLEHAEIFLVSDLEPAFVRRLFMEPYADVQSAYEAAAKRLGPAADVIVMPYGGSTLPTPPDE